MAEFYVLLRTQESGTRKRNKKSTRLKERERERRKMSVWKKFDPWPVFFKREWNRNWPFLVGFAVTGTLITKFSLSLTDEDVKNSPFVQRHKKLALENEDAHHGFQASTI
ncbi:hypothetical protein V2J09_002855 [Rumex salicifolius]